MPRTTLPSKRRQGGWEGRHKARDSRPGLLPDAPQASTRAKCRRDRRSARKRQKYRLLLYIIPYHHTKIPTAWLQLRRALRVLRYPAHAHARAEDGQCPICAARAVKSLRLGTGMRVCHGSHVWRGRQSDTVCRVRPGCMRVKIPHCRICHYLHPNLHRTDRSIRAGPILRRPPILTFNN